MKNRLPRKLKKKLNKEMKKAVAIFKSHKEVLHQQFVDNFVWGFSAVHVNSKTGEMKNVPIDEAYKLLNKQ